MSDFILGSVSACASASRAPRHVASMAAYQADPLRSLLKSAGVSHYMKTNATTFDMVRAEADTPSPVS